VQAVRKIDILQVYEQDRVVNSRNFFAELKRRNVYKVAVAYAVLAWLLIQVATQLFPLFGIPNWAVRLVVLLLILGFPAALVLSWAFEITPEGIKRSEDVAPNESIRRQTGRNIVGITVALAVVAAGFFLFRLLQPNVTESLLTKSATTESPIPDKSIAVLPFENLSEDKANAYFVDGIQDEILTRLAKISALKVISRTSTRRYASRPDNLREIAKQLGVASILEGSVQRVGGAVRVNVQLIDASKDRHLWAETYDRDIKDIFSVESEIAQAVADALKAQLLPAESARIAHVPTMNPLAYDRFLKAEYLLNQLVWTSSKDPNDVARKAEGLYESAIAADPDFALAYAQLSYLKSIVYWFGIDPSPPVIDAARAAAVRALALQPDLAEAHLAIGYVHYWGHRDYNAALAEFAIARASLPNDSDVLKAMARVHRRQGNLLQAIPEFGQATTLDPRDTDLAREIGVTLACLRRYAQADAAFARSTALAPDNAYAYVYRAGALQLSGDMEAASKVLASVPAELDPQGAVSLQRCYLAMAMRQPDAALAVLSKAPAWLNTATDGLMMPATLWRGQALAAKGENGAARSAFLEAKQALEEKRRAERESAGTESYLSLAYAGLGEKDAALNAGRRATELLPMSQDVLSGAWYLYQLAQVEAQFGDHESAIKHIEQLLAAPAGFYVSDTSLHADPAWDPLRKNERFAALMKKMVSPK
jgi:TolB-like protein/Flp pilus assembly protein TadD